MNDTLYYFTRLDSSSSINLVPDRFIDLGLIFFIQRVDSGFGPSGIDFLMKLVTLTALAERETAAYLFPYFTHFHILS